MSEPAKIGQDAIINTVSINRLTRVAKEGTLKMEVTSESRTSINTKPVLKTSFEAEKNSYAMKRIVGHENRPTRT